MKRRLDVGTLYKGSPTGQWAWAMHRITGVGILLFLFAHVIDTALVAWGPETYNTVIALYKNPFVMTMELGLVGAVIFHGLNGIRIMIIDFWPKAALYDKTLTFWTLTLLVASMAPITWFMGRRIIEGIF
ncbi:MAG: succinate dehydrogenase, cytochrome b556 subunit [Actinomycetota bacterium]